MCLANQEGRTELLRQPPSEDASAARPTCCHGVRFATGHPPTAPPFATAATLSACQPLRLPAAPPASTRTAPPDALSAVSAAAAFPLVTIFVKDEDACQIGVPARWSAKWV